MAKNKWYECNLDETKVTYKEIIAVRQSSYQKVNFSQTKILLGVFQIHSKITVMFARTQRPRERGHACPWQQGQV